MQEKRTEMGIRLKVRFDYKGKKQGNRFLFRAKNSEQAAEQIREQKIALLRNVPVQGIQIEEIDSSGDIYTVYDEYTGTSVSYAPVVIKLSADSLEDAIQFVAKEEFRTVEVLEPEQMTLEKINIERLLFRVNEELKAYQAYLEKKLEFWK